MAGPLTLMCVLAHPDDESLGLGGTLARYAAEGVETYLVVATRGERGWQGDPADNPGLEELGRVRERELREAARVLGLREVALLGYVDGDLDRADPAEAVARIAGHLRRVRPQVVLTFGPEGGYGHPDHIAVSQLAMAAVVRAAEAAYAEPAGLPPHSVSKLYYKVWTAAEEVAIAATFGEIVMPVDGVDRQGAAWPEWLITTRLDTAAHWRTVWEAISRHRSQLPSYDLLARLPPEEHQRLWGTQGYYRVFSLVNGGRALERDLFEGLR